jgi:hypothetical protein
MKNLCGVDTCQQIETQKNWRQRSILVSFINSGKDSEFLNAGKNRDIK